MFVVVVSKASAAALHLVPKKTTTEAIETSALKTSQTVLVNSISESSSGYYSPCKDYDNRYGQLSPTSNVSYTAFTVNKTYNGQCHVNTPQSHKRIHSVVLLGENYLGHHGGATVTPSPVKFSAILEKSVLWWF